MFMSLYQAYKEWVNKLANSLFLQVHFFNNTQFCIDHFIFSKFDDMNYLKILKNHDIKHIIPYQILFQMGGCIDKNIKYNTIPNPFSNGRMNW